MYHLYRVVLSRLPPGWDDMFLNAFKCNLNELTKSTLLPEVCGHSTCACPVVCYSCTTFMWFSGVESFLCAALSMLPDFFKPSSSPLPPPPSPYSSFSADIFQCDVCLFLFPFLCGGSWLGWAIVPAIRALFNPGTGCQKWASLDAPGNQPPSSYAVVNTKLINHLQLLSRNWKLGTQDRGSTGADSRGELSVRCKRFSFTQWQCYSCTWVTKWKLHGKPCRIGINRKIRQTKSTSFRGTRKYMHS